MTSGLSSNFVQALLWWGGSLVKGADYRMGPVRYPRCDPQAYRIR